MKKLKNILPLFLISFFLFIGNANAETSEHTVSFTYDSEFYQTVNNDINNARLNALHEYIETVGSFCVNSYCLSTSSGKMLIKIVNIDTNVWSVYIAEPYEMYSYYNVSTSSNRKVIGYNNVTMQYNVTFNSENVITDFSRVGTGGNLFEFLFGDTPPINVDVILSVSGLYFDTYFLNDSFTFKFVENSGAFQSSYGINIPIKLDRTDVVYNPGANIPVKSFFDSFIPNIVPVPNQYSCLFGSTIGGNRLGTISDFTTFTYQSIDRINKDSSYLKHFIEFQFSENVSSDYFAYFVEDKNNNSDLYLYYNYSCNIETANDMNSCRVEYWYYTDSEDFIDVDLRITIRKDDITDNTVKTVYLYTCPPSNNMSNVNYGYIDNTDVNNIINNQSSPNLGMLSNIVTMIPQGPVDSILMLPLKMLDSLTDALTGNCTPVDVPLPYVDRNIQLQCINSFYDEIHANTFVTSVGLVASTLMLVKYFVFLYNWLDNVIQLGRIKLQVWGDSQW